MKFWNVIDSCKSTVTYYSKAANAANVSDVNSEINISIKQNQINDKLNSLSSLLLNPDSQNANHAELITQNVKSLARNISSCEIADPLPPKQSSKIMSNKRIISKSDISFTKSNDNMQSKNIPNNISNSINNVIRKYNQAVINSATSIKSNRSSIHNKYIQGDSDFLTLNDALISLTSNLHTAPTNQIINNDMNDIYYSEINNLDSIIPNSLERRITRASSNSDYNQIKESRNVLNFHNINNNGNNSDIKKTVNNKYMTYPRELHGLERYIQNIQKGSFINQYIRNLISAVIAVIICCCIIGMVSYASTLF